MTASSDPSGGFASNRYTIPIDGVYLFVAQWGGAGSGASNLGITKNSTTSPFEIGNDLNLGNGGANYFRPVITTFIPCVKGDVIGLAAFSATTSGADSVVFKGIMISK